MSVWVNYTMSSGKKYALPSGLFQELLLLLVGPSSGSPSTSLGWKVSWQEAVMLCPSGEKKCEEKINDNQRTNAMLILICVSSCSLIIALLLRLPVRKHTYNKLHQSIKLKQHPGNSRVSVSYFLHFKENQLKLKQSYLKLTLHIKH